MIRVDLNNDLSSRQMINRGVWAAGLLLIMTFSLFVDPERVTFFSCFFRDMTGYSCPTCGLSHSFYAMSHLHLLESFRFHWMGPVLHLSMFILFLKFIFEITMKRELTFRLNAIMVKINLLCLSCIWIGFCVFRFISEVKK